MLTLLVAWLAAFQAPPAQAPGQPAAAPPATEVFLATLEGAPDGGLRVTGPENISRNPGYDNQPFFTDDGVLFTSMRDGRQTDVYHYSLASRAITRLTDTPESEYSPTRMSDGRISVIRVEADGTQRLWAFTARGESPVVLLNDVKPVGYHVWADPATLVLFVLGEPPTLRIADTRSGRAEIVAERPGRCLARTPAGKISFVQKGAGKEPWQVMELDTTTRKAVPLTETLEGREDYAWLPDGRLLMASGSKIFVWNPKGGAKGWQAIADLQAAGIAGITRLAVSGDGKRLAITGEGESKDER